MPSDSPDDRQRILLVTGMLGAGKTTALHELEDLGWEAIDNFPIRMLPRLIGRESERDNDAPPLAIGFDSRTRGFAPDAIIERVKQLNDRPDLEVTTLFLDCSDAELQRRFDETRRRHHLAHDMPVEAGIRAERDLVAPLRRWADVLIDTTRFSAKELQQVIRQHFSGASREPMTVTVSSFGFAKGVPPNRSVSRTAPEPESTRLIAFAISRRRASMSSLGPMQMVATSGCSPTTCSIAWTNSSASRPWVTRIIPIMRSVNSRSAFPRPVLAEGRAHIPISLPMRPLNQFRRP